MKKTKHLARWLNEHRGLLALSALVVYTLLLVGTVRSCHHDARPQPKTVVKWQKQYIPMPAETIRIQLPSEVDTVEVIQEYFTKKVYRDTVLHNDTVTLVLQDTIWQNSIADRTVSLTFNAAHFTKANSVSVGTVLGFQQAGLLASWRHRRWQLSAGWNFVDRSPVVGASYTLFEW